MFHPGLITERSPGTAIFQINEKACDTGQIDNFSLLLLVGSGVNVREARGPSRESDAVSPCSPSIRPSDIPLLFNLQVPDQHSDSTEYSIRATAIAFSSPLIIEVSPSVLDRHSGLHHCNNFCFTWETKLREFWAEPRLCTSSHNDGP
ncbi:hypothetical protein M407DRAFT_244941 [Tulasnella calospora MUT 4182]|uniref:Uncharacterized protein n=1 Tax=Tulasnella calospora MUT 4182 TaxID=1051891 RepID=A0A0C3QCE8_9AGAM|nr:hypothetical protein M407DRAFT_244941 [Tulasnella calospora MUT 4182]